MPKTSGGRGRARKGNGEPKANHAAEAESKAAKAAAEKPRRGRRPGSGRKAAAAAAPAAPAARRKGGRAPAADKAARKSQPVPASTRGVALPHTLADVSRAVNVSATTIKYYLSHLPRLIEFEGHGRKRRFSDRAVQMLSDVRRMLSDENKSLNQIRQELEHKSSHGGHHHVEAAPSKKESAPAAPARGARAAAAVHHKAPSGSLEDLMGVLIHEVKGMRAEVEKLRRTRWIPHE